MSPVVLVTLVTKKLNVGPEGRVGELSSPQRAAARTTSGSRRRLISTSECARVGWHVRRGARGRWRFWHDASRDRSSSSLRLGIDGSTVYHLNRSTIGLASSRNERSSRSRGPDTVATL